ncbi:MAG TPA: magnesium chelatase, partial [Verrucomicrobiales bacterium]|nr:magnesium chelatase [Verrucomicrobiales bacterium]
DRHEAVLTRKELLELVSAAREVRITDEMKEYIVALVSATRGSKEVRLAASPRASLALMRVSQALSLFEGRDFVVPETIQQLAVDVIAHRLVVETEAEYSGRCARVLVEELLQTTPVPS